MSPDTNAALGQEDYVHGYSEEHRAFLSSRTETREAAFFLPALKPGMRADISTDSFPGKRYRAWLGYISPSSEFTPKSVETTELRSSLVYQVRIFVCNPQDELRLGMPATVTIPLNEPAAPESSRCQNP